MVSGGGKRIKDKRRHGDAYSPYPSSRLIVWHSTFDHPRSRHVSLLRGHAMNQQLEIVLPSRSAVDVAEAIKWETSFYYEVTMPLALLLSPRFIQEYILSGTVTMIAKNVAIDSHNTAMLLPSGTLLLLVDNETYSQLGLIGHRYGQQTPAEAQSAKQHRAARGQRFVIEIDLKNPAFLAPAAEPNAYRDRVLHCLSTKFEPMEMIVAAYNERGAPRTIIFGDDDTIERKRVEVNGSMERLQDVIVPELHQFYKEATDGTPIEMDVLRESLHAVHDWLGVVATRMTELLQGQPLEEYVSTFHGVPDGSVIPVAEHSELSTVRWRGLITSEFVQRVVDRIKEAVASEKLPWAAVTVWGIPDAIVVSQQEYEAKPSRWQHKKAADERPPPPVVETREHGYLVNGANNYTLLLLPQQEYFALQEVGAHDSSV